MKSKSGGKSRANGLKFWQIFICSFVMAILAFTSQAQTSTGSVLGWNNLGMHCADGDYSVLCILPPYNTINAQVIDSTGHLITNQSGVSVTYQAIADPTGSINKTSVGKTNFWDYVQPLFGVQLQPDVGLPVPGPNSYSMPGAGNVPQAMSYEAAFDWKAAYGIPITATDEAGNINNYPLMRLTAKNGTTTIATRDIVLPISTEINCQACHGSGSSGSAQPADGWVNIPEVERDFRLNVLRLHDDRQLGTPVFATALANANFDPAGLYATVIANNKPILCASCHISEALPGSGQPGIPALTSAIHTLHGKVNDPANGMLLDSNDNRTSCYYCHPGKATKCLRGVMGRAVAANGQLAIQCQDCHGSMSLVGSATRTGWLDEPTCQACHTGDAVANAGQIRYETVFSSGNVMRTVSNQRFATTPNSPAAGLSLYRFSRGHGGLYCQACHNSTHAEFPSIDENDNIISKQQQGYIGPIAECQSCHGTTPNTVSGGPHGLHPMGQTWVSGHQDNAGSSCRVCHGTDYRGTVLSRARTDRTLNAFGTKVFWRGFQIGCYNCHNGPNSESSSSNTPAVVRNLTASTTVGKAVAIPLQASDANNNTLTLRVVSQPSNGTAGLSGTVITYFPDAGYAGSDTLTYAAWDGSTDSNLGTINITVTGSGGGSGCAYTITPANATLGSGASSSTVAVGTTPGCAWTAVSGVPWITVTSGASGNGSGTVAYSVAANTGTTVRSGTMTIAGQSFIVNQAAPGVVCVYSISPTSLSTNSSARTGSVAVTTTAECAWTAVSGVPWITVTSGASGTGSGTVAYSIAANTATSARTGTVTIAGQTFTVSQGASAVTCVYTLTPTSSSITSSARTGTVSVSTTPGCAWTAASGVSWITITSGASGTGSGSVSYSVAANTGSSGRTGLLTIA
ncbi:MAG: BACON domain-containing carbohydrate-binding protein, partial [Victivallales bacterium]